MTGLGGKLSLPPFAASSADGRAARTILLPLPEHPQKSICSGPFEAEGVDYDVATGVLRVEIIQQRHDHEPVPAGR
jgi:hypothetical protein